MEFIKKQKEENIERDYPTYEEYLEEIKNVHEKELKSDRYTSAYTFLSNNYWNRQNINLENELFKIIETYHITENEDFDKSDDYKKMARLKRYVKLKHLIDSLTEEQINSNIFLKSASLFMKTSVKDCQTIINKLNEIINNDNQSKSITVNCDIPNETIIHIPDYISTQTGIKYYRPQEYKIEYIDVLDSYHKYVYDDYNACIRTIGKIADDIYFLQLNNIITTLSYNLICYHFHVYHPGFDNHFNASFFIRSLKNIQKPTCEETFIPTDDFIQATINNFQTLLDMRIIDMTVLKDKNDEHTLKKTLI